MLAGFELELGDEKAKTAAANQRAERAIVGAIIGSALGLILGAAAGIGIAAEIEGRR